MKKRYLKTIEDIEALRNTGTKIYRENLDGYFKFVNGVLCIFKADSTYVYYNATMDFNQVVSSLYIEVEDEPSEDLIGKLGWFWDDDETTPTFIDILKSIDRDADFKYKAEADGYPYQFFKLLTPEEVEKYTGYKVKEK